jgi:hypothetical protein
MSANPVQMSANPVQMSVRVVQMSADPVQMAEKERGLRYRGARAPVGERTPG